jgi:hypothetical protein
VKLVIILIVIAIIVLVNVFQKPIVHALEPAANWMHRSVRFGFASGLPSWGCSPQYHRCLADPHRHHRHPVHSARELLLFPSQVQLTPWTQLFGQEVVFMFIGLTWGPGIGMAIASGGTLLGELGTF